MKKPYISLAARIRRMLGSLQVCFRFSVKRPQADCPSPPRPASSPRPQIPSDTFSTIVLLFVLLPLPLWPSLSPSVFLLFPAAVAVATCPCLSHGRSNITSTELSRNKLLETCTLFSRWTQGEESSTGAGRISSGGET